MPWAALWVWIWCNLCLSGCGVDKQWGKHNRVCAFFILKQLNKQGLTAESRGSPPHHLVTVPGRTRHCCLIQAPAAVSCKVNTADIQNRANPSLLILTQCLSYRDSPKELTKGWLQGAAISGDYKEQPFMVPKTSNNTIPQIAFISSSVHHFVTISAICVLSSPFGRVCEIFMNV